MLCVACGATVRTLASGKCEACEASGRHRDYALTRQAVRGMGPILRDALGHPAAGDTIPLGERILRDNLTDEQRAMVEEIQDTI